MFSFALRNVMSRPVRTALAILGMTVAIMGMVSLFSIAEGLNQVIGNTLNRVPGLVAMQRGAPIPLFSTLPKTWLNELEAIPGVRAVSPECWARANVIEGQVVVSPPRLLCGIDIVRRNRLETGVYRDDIVLGRFLNEEDLGTNHCVVSTQIASEHDKQVGETIEVNGYDLTIVGLYYTGSLLLDVAIIMDDSRFREMARFDANTVSSFYIEQDGTASDQELLDRIQEHFRGRGPKAWQGSALLSGSGSGNPLQDLLRGADQYFRQLTRGTESPTTDSAESLSSPATRPNEKLAPAETQQAPPREAEPRRSSSRSKKGSESSVDDDPMEVRLATEWAGRIDKFAEDLNLALWLLTSLGVFIALISIINTMLMSVTERISEFGILRANGWSRLALMQLIGWESFLLGVTGGFLGCLSGWSLTIIVNAAFPQRFNLFASPSLLLFALGFSAALGLLSGLYPAFWAARLNPMEAIRRN